jgi:Transposase DDE domain
VESFAFEESWELIRKCFPSDLDEVARQSGSLKRIRRVGGGEVLLRLLLMHGSGLSLEQTAIRAQEQALGRISAVGLFKRVRSSEAFVRALCEHLLEAMRERIGHSSWPDGYRYRIVDATEVTEPGATGSSWRLHYSLRLPELSCDQFKLTRFTQGESFEHWHFEANEVILADRAYSTRAGLVALLGSGAKMVVRLKAAHFALHQSVQKPFDLLTELRKLSVEQTRSWNIGLKNGKQFWPLRLCAIKKSEQATQRSQRKAQRRAQQDGVEIRSETLELAGYVLVLTNLEPQAWPAASILELYRCRWQIELAFKRLKSLLQLGHLPKRDIESARAWMQIKLLIALLTEHFAWEARFFSPWGYRLEPNQPLDGLAGGG